MKLNDEFIIFQIKYWEIVSYCIEPGFAQRYAYIYD